MRNKDARFAPLPLGTVFLAVQACFGSAWAQDACGPVPAGPDPTMTCAAGGDYSGGISYIDGLDNGLDLTLESGLTVTGSGPDFHGVDLATSSSNTLRLTAELGTEINVSGEIPQGLKLKGQGDIVVDSGANITLKNTDVSEPDSGAGAYAIVAEVLAPDAESEVRILQREGTKLTTQGRGTSGIGIIHHASGRALVTTSGEIETSGPYSFGVSLLGQGSGTANLKIVQTERGRILSEGDLATGIYAQSSGAGGNAEAEIHGTITARGLFATGAVMYVGIPGSDAHAKILVSGTGKVRAEGLEAVGLYALTSGLGEVGVTSSGQITAEGDSPIGILLSTKTRNDDNATPANTGHDAPVYADILGGRVDATGANARGILIVSEGSSRLSTFVAANASVEAVGDDAIGVDIAGLENGDAQIDVQIAGAVGGQGRFGVGVAAMTGEGEASVTVDSNGEVTGGWQADASGTSAEHDFASAGVILGSNTHAGLLNAGRIGAASDRAVRFEGGTGTGTRRLENHGTVTGFVEMDADGQNTFINAAGGEFALRHFADTTGDGTRDTKRVARSGFGGGSSLFENRAGATLRLAAVEGATDADATNFYLPRTGIDDRLLPADVYDLTREGIVQGQLLGLAEFGHAGTIDLRGPAIGNTLVITGAATAADGPGGGVFVSNGGALRLRAGQTSATPEDPTDRYADMLIVDGTRLGEGGPTRVLVDYEPSSIAHLTTGNGIQIVEVRDQAASEDGVFVLGNRVAGGVYEYSLYHGGIAGDEGDGNWYLRSSELYRLEVPVVMATPALAHRLGLDVLGTYHDRVGEGDAVFGARPGTARGGDGQRVWGRIFGRSGKVGGGSDRVRALEQHGPRYDFDLSGFQLGMNLHDQIDDDGTHDVASVYFAATHASARVDSVTGSRAGKISMDGYTVGASWTHRKPEGAYVDAVAQLTRYDHVNVRAVQGDTIRPDGWGVTLSIEGGYPFELDEHWSLEPQAQLVYQRIDLGGRTHDRSGLIDLDDSTATYGRLGARLTRDWKNADGHRRTVWARANLWHDFNSRARTTFSSFDGQETASLKTDLGGRWAQIGLGFDTQIKDRLSAFAGIDYEKGLGGNRFHTVSARVGMHYVW